MIKPRTASIHALAIFAIATTALAQSYVTSPPGFETTGSTGLSSYSITFGAYFDERSQIADGNYKGTAFSIKEIALRRDEQAITAYNANGRTWSNFQLKFGECDSSKLTNDWDKNFLATPTMVYSSTLKWPGPGQATGTPEPWGDLPPVKGSLLFPFTSAQLYTGANDMLLEFQFYGGTLDNSAAWGGYNQSYYLDGTSNIATVGGGVSVPVPGTDPIMTSCALTGQAKVGYGYLRVVTYAVHNDPNLPKGSSDSFEASYCVRSTPGVTGILAVSLGGTNDVTNSLSLYIGGRNSTTGEANIGCMPLGLDATQPWLFHGVSNTGTSTLYESTRYYLKYDKNLAGLTPVYGQFAYSDPTTNAFHLTGTGKSLIFDQPVLNPWKNWVIGDYGSGNRGPQPRSGTGPAPSTRSVPLLRYTK